jgi:hypothetical protein
MESRQAGDIPQRKQRDTVNKLISQFHANHAERKPKRVSN